ncbi:MAG: response regulator [Myxococcota bacterium]
MAESRGHVLIVDDEVFFREAIDEILSAAGFQTGMAEDGKSALEKVADPSIGVVVLDVRLPDLDGIQVLARIREMRPAMPVIMLSASTDQEIVLEALRLGASDYLAKPLHDEELVLAVGRARDRYEVVEGRRRLRARIDRFVEGLEALSRIVRLAEPGDRVSVLRQGIVDSVGAVLEASRISLMLLDPVQELLCVVASRGSVVELESLTACKIGEGPAGVCFAEGSVMCVLDAAEDDRFEGRSAREYASSAFVVIPLVCLGVPVGVLCVTEAQDADDIFLEEISLLRLLGMQISEFLAADPEVEQLLESAEVMDADGVDPLRTATHDGDAEIARVVCEAVAAEPEPGRMLHRALSAVSSQLAAAPVALFMLCPDGSTLELEAEADGGVVRDRASLPAGQGLAGMACQSGQLVAVEQPEQDARFAADIDTAADGQIRPYLCLPLSLRGNVVGLLRVFLEAGQPASPRTAEVLAAAFSAALRNVLLYRSLLESIDEVAQARREARS